MISCLFYHVVSTYRSLVGGKSRQKWEFVIGMPAEELSPLICPTLLTHKLARWIEEILAPGTVTSSETDVKPYKNGVLVMEQIQNTVTPISCTVALYFVSDTRSCHFILGPEIILVRGLLKLVPAVAYHFCLNLPATFSQPRTSIISGPSIIKSRFPYETLCYLISRFYCVVIIVSLDLK